ncbi:helix-turn-helix domain-containing protein [Chloroflexota bacterium]
MDRDDNNKNLGRILKQQRLMIPLTLNKLATVSGVSSSHLGRIERGERFPSASILQKIARPLAFKEGEVFYLAGYLSSQSVGIEQEKAG